MRKIPLTRVLFILLVAGATCNRGNRDGDVVMPTPEEQYRQAMDLYDAGKFRESAEAFKNLALRATVNPYTAEAEYYLGMSYLAYGEKEKAQGAFSAVITMFPNSPMGPLAYIGLARSYLAQAPAIPRDQEKTADAIATLEEFLRKYPDHEKAPEAKALLDECRDRLARKDLIAIDVYENLMKYESELHYANLFLDDYPESGLRWQAMLYKARALYYLNRDQEALDVLGKIESGDVVPGDVKYDAAKLRLAIQARQG